jgi:biotin transport system substrate-specific component
MAEAHSVPFSRYFALGSDHIVAQTFWIVTFALLTAVGAQIEIPHQPVPYTFQTLFVLLAGAMLGKRNGFLSMLLYLTLGSVGVPVFAGASFGLARILGPTGGYLLSFPVAAFVIAYLISVRPSNDSGGAAPFRRTVVSYGWTFGALMIGLVLIFLLGTAQLNLVYFHNWSTSLASGFVIFSWWDLLKLIAATAISHQFARR